MRKLLLASLVTVVGLALIIPQPVSAATPADIFCPFSLTVNMDPGFTLTSQSQNVTGEVKGGTSFLSATPCSSLAGAPHKGGIGKITGSGQQNCLLQGSLSGTIDFTWDNGDTSTIAWSESLVLFVPIVTATVTGGAFQGNTLTAILIPTGFSGSCILGPARSLTFVGILATFG